MFHSSRTELNCDHFDIHIGNEQIEQVPFYKYLDVYIESDMHWKSQVQNVCYKLAYGCHILLKARDYFDFIILRMLSF